MNKNLLPPTPRNNKNLNRRLLAALRVAIARADGDEQMEVDVGYLDKREVEVAAAYFLKRGWQAAAYKWVDAYERHYCGHGSMKVVWVGDGGVAKKVKARYTQRGDECDGDGAPYGGR